MTELSQRIAQLSPAQRELLLLQLKKEQGFVLRKGVSGVNPPKPLDLKAEAVLDSTIRPHPLQPYRPVTEPLFIFFTGGTGFLGAFLLQELLHRTRADIYCLVRAADAYSGKRRLQANMEQYGVWNERFSSRIIPVLGDVSKPMLGFAPEQYQILAHKIDTIYHSAALLNYVYPYSALKKINVLGTQEILKFACHVKVKLVHYISSVAIFESSAYAGKVLEEDGNFDQTKGMFLGYSQSKWVSERLVIIARDRGLPVCIYRPPFILGHSKTGIGNTDDFLALMIKGCLQIGTFPDIDYLMDASPVDYVGKAIAYLSLQKESIGKAFHLQHPQPLPLNQVVEWLKEGGYSIEHVTYEAWQKHLKASMRSEESALYKLRPFLFERWTEEQLTIPEMYFQSRRPKLSCQKTLKALAGSSIVCPPLEPELFSNYLVYFINKGFVKMEDLSRLAENTPEELAV
ncbi:thioester reductase domain-containing protein [Lyngbya aestuarii]|uniref:thioester reductase domain-containing protein n=1 Tax=Lyngbya aestuarii TaxID=118322 RepID=UPI00403D9732